MHCEMKERMKAFSPYMDAGWRGGRSALESAFH